MAFLKKVWLLTKRTFKESSKDRVSRLSASVAYYAVFCIAPLLVIAVRIAAIFFGEGTANAQLSTQLKVVMGAQAAGAVLSLVTKASSHDSHSVIATLFSIAIFVYAALILFDELQQSMNTIWKVERKPSTSWWKTFRDQIVSLGIVFGTLLLFLISLIISTRLPEVVSSAHRANNFMGRPVEATASLTIFSLIFAVGYKFLPDAKVAWKDVWIAAIAAGALFTLGKYLLGAYLVRSSGTSFYGVTGSVAVVLIWVYYSARVFFFGAEFTQVYSQQNDRQNPTG
jgi:membrane protein